MIKITSNTYQFTDEIINRKVLTDAKTIDDLCHNIDGLPFDVMIVDVIDKNIQKRLTKYLYLRGALYKVLGKRIINTENVELQKISAYDVEGTMHLLVYI